MKPTTMVMAAFAATFVTILGAGTARLETTKAAKRDWLMRVVESNEEAEKLVVDSGPPPEDKRVHEKSDFISSSSDQKTTVGQQQVLATAMNGSKPHILVFLMDDLGYYDVGFADNAREETQRSTPYISSLAKEEGIILTRHYAHWHCSPSRRSFLTGRLPMHAGGDDLTYFLDDDQDMRFTWISEKLKLANYFNLFYGKVHIGTESVRMLPSHRGFDDFWGFLDGSQTYSGSGGRWRNFAPNYSSKYSTELFGDQMVEQIEKELGSASPRPIFLFSSMQVPHTPLQKAPRRISRYRNAWGEQLVQDSEGNVVERFNLLQWVMYYADVEIQRVIELFKKDKALWDNTLIVFISDNGGTTTKAPGNNFPLRGEKGTSFEGSYRGTGFISGGVIPESLRGTKNDKIMHIADWYRTFCNLAGVDAEDDPPQAPKHGVDSVADPQFPNVTLTDGSQENIWGDFSFPRVDSKDLWPFLMNPSESGVTGIHSQLMLSREVFLKGHLKLILAQPCSTGITSTLEECKDDAHYGWVDQNNLWTDEESLPCLQKFDVRKTEAYNDGIFRFQPCLFNITADPREQNPLDDPEQIASIWADFNSTLVHQYTIQLPQKELYGMTPFFCKGPCFIPEVAIKHFDLRNKKELAPHCGIFHTEFPHLQYCEV